MKCGTNLRSASCQFKFLNVQFSIYLSNPFCGCGYISHRIWFVEGLDCSRAQGQLLLHNRFIIVLWAPAQHIWQQKTITDNRQNKDIIKDTYFCKVKIWIQTRNWKMLFQLRVIRKATMVKKKKKTNKQGSNGITVNNCLFLSYYWLSEIPWATLGVNNVD